MRFNFSTKKYVTLSVLLFTGMLLFAQKNLPQGYGKLRFGMTVSEVQEVLRQTPQFGYRGERDVSMLPKSEKVLIETDASKVPGSFYDRCWFQFNEGKLYIIIINLNKEKIDWYSVFTTLNEKYGNPGKLNPEKAEWKNSSVIMSLEKPLTLKYTDAVVFEKLQNEAYVQKSAEQMTREKFLEGL